MKLLFILSAFFVLTVSGYSQTFDPEKYIIQNEDSLAQSAIPPPHHGEGSSVGYYFFKEVKDYKTAFKKRVLKPNSGMGYHQQKDDEVYYVINGRAEMKLNDKIYTVKTGDAILTRTGSWHSIRNLSDKDNLELIIVYERKLK